MALEKILVGDDQISFAKANFPFIPNTEVEFVSNPQELVQKAKTGQYSLIITDLNYTENGQEGFNVLKEIQGINARKILWTGNAYDKDVKEKAKSLDAEVLDKDELGTLVGQVVNKAPLKENGKILLYVPKNSGTLARALEQVLSLFSKPGKVKVSSDIKEELATEQYGLVIDASQLANSEKKAHGTVAHDMKYLKLKEVPRVVCLSNVSEAVVDIAKLVSKFYDKP